MYTTDVGQETVRDRLGITLKSGIMPFTGIERQLDQVRDWPGIWLTCAALVAACWVVFAVFFPRGGAEEP